MNMVQDFAIDDLRDCVQKIHNVNIRNFVDSALYDIAPEFWVQAASPSGRYHPPENNLVRGLVIHTVKAFYVGEELFSFYNVYDELEKDIVRAALILHDTMKGDPKWVSTVYDHGTRAARRLDTIEFQGSRSVVQRIQNAIMMHMSRWTYDTSALKMAATPTKLDRIVQMADFIASRNYISFYPLIGVEVKNR